jgi:hypothetical protein
LDFYTLASDCFFALTFVLALAFAYGFAYFGSLFGFGFQGLRYKPEISCVRAHLDSTLNSGFEVGEVKLRRFRAVDF